MVIRKALVALASVGLVFGSTAAAAAPVADRAASPVEEAESLRGNFGWILAIIIIAGVIGIVVSDGNESVSP